MRNALGIGLLLSSILPAAADGVTSLQTCTLFGDGDFTLEFVLDHSWPDRGRGTVIINQETENNVWFLSTEHATLVFNSDDDGKWLAMFDHDGGSAWGSLHDGHGDLRAIMQGTCS